MARSTVAFKIDPRSTADLAKRLDKLGGVAARKIVRPAVTAALTPVTKAAKRNAKPHGANFRKSIVKKIKLYRRTGTIYGAVGNRRERTTGEGGRVTNPQNIAHLLEWGHKPSGWYKKMEGASRVPGSRWLTRAFDEARRKAASILETQVRRRMLAAAVRR